MDKLIASFSNDYFLKDQESVKIYSHDTSTAQKKQAALIFLPKTTEDVSRFLKLCNDSNTSVIPSGGRTGLSGGASVINNEVVLSLTRMNKIKPIEHFSKTVRVEAGAITQNIHDHCQKEGLTWPVDFASKGSSQVGGNIATNAGGINVIHYGMTRNWVQSIKVVLMNGEILELNGELDKNNSGLDLRHLFIGSEGILGVITQATLKLTRYVSDKTVLISGFDDKQNLEKAITWSKTQINSLSACEYISQKCFEIVKIENSFQELFKKSYQGYLLIELPTDNTESLTSNGAPFSDQKTIMSTNSTQFKALWAFRERISETISRNGNLYRSDISIPLKNIWTFLDELNQMLQIKYPKIDVYTFGHIGDGNLHIDFKWSDSSSLPVNDFEPDYFGLIQKFNGSISAEHGVGLIKKHLLKYTRTQTEIDLIKNIKKVFDPKGLLNPGKMI